MSWTEAKAPLVDTGFTYRGKRVLLETRDSGIARQMQREAERDMPFLTRADAIEEVGEDMDQ